MHPALLMLLMFNGVFKGVFPPLNTYFWTTNLGDYVKTNLNQRIIFKPQV